MDNQVAVTNSNLHEPSERKDESLQGHQNTYDRFLTFSQIVGGALVSVFIGMLFYKYAFTPKRIQQIDLRTVAGLNMHAWEKIKKRLNSDNLSDKEREYLLYRARNIYGDMVKAMMRYVYEYPHSKIENENLRKGTFKVLSEFFNNYNHVKKFGFKELESGLSSRNETIERICFKLLWSENGAVEKHLFSEFQKENISKEYQFITSWFNIQINNAIKNQTYFEMPFNFSKDIENLHLAIITPKRRRH